MIDKIIGSEELKNSIPRGTVTKMSIVFDKSVGWIGDVVKGKRIGNPLIIECAERVADLLEELEVEEKVKSIIEDYGSTYKN